MDEILAFAELEAFANLKLAHYSSGMSSRLAYAVAFHAVREVLVLDEIFAVGDAGFQAKCVDRMMKLVGEGRTLLFVSHNLWAVEAVCRRGLFLLDGKVEAIGDVREVLRSYLDWVDARQLARLDGEALSGPSRTLKIERISFHGAAGVERTAFSTGEEMEIRLRVRAEIPLRRPCFSLGIGHSGTPNMVIAFSMLGDGQIPDLIDGVFERAAGLAESLMAHDDGVAVGGKRHEAVFAG